MYVLDDRFEFLLICEATSISEQRILLQEVLYIVVLS